MITKSMQGHACPYKPTLCSEGWCNDCQIHLDFKGHERTMGRDSVVNRDICLRCGVNRTGLRTMMIEGGKENLTLVDVILGNCPACNKALGGKG